MTVGLKIRFALGVLTVPLFSYSARNRKGGNTFRAHCSVCAMRDCTQVSNKGQNCIRLTEHQEESLTYIMQRHITRHADFPFVS